MNVLVFHCFLIVKINVLTSYFRLCYIMQIQPEIGSNLSTVVEGGGLKRSVRSRVEVRLEEEMLKGQGRYTDITLFLCPLNHRINFPCNMTVIMLRTYPILFIII